MKKNRNSTKSIRKIRVRAKIIGHGKRPRLTIFRSNKHIYAQIIDDEKGITLASASEKDIIVKSKEEKKQEEQKKSKTDKAVSVGTTIATKAQKIGITDVVFDRGPCKYHGRIKSIAEAARKNGLNF